MRNANKEAAFNVPRFVGLPRDGTTVVLLADVAYSVSILVTQVMMAAQSV